LNDVDVHSYALSHSYFIAQCLLATIKKWLYDWIDLHASWYCTSIASTKDHDKIGKLKYKNNTINETMHDSNSSHQSS
jgi:hypothetical protein